MSGDLLLWFTIQLALSPSVRAYLPAARPLVRARETAGMLSAELVRVWVKTC